MSAMSSSAKRDDWEHEPLPEARAPLTFDLPLNAQELRRVAIGLVPRQTEDKWFIFLEGDNLRFHRSWTGVCIYEVRVERLADGARLTDAWVNRDPEQYRGDDDEYDARMLRFLVDRLLLGRVGTFPARADGEGNPMLELHHAVGYARSNDEL